MTKVKIYTNDQGHTQDFAETIQIFLNNLKHPYQIHFSTTTRHQTTVLSALIIYIG